MTITLYTIIMYYSVQPYNYRILLFHLVVKLIKQLINITENVLSIIYYNHYKHCTCIVHI